jgi:CheY-like chemotaxis protein
MTEASCLIADVQLPGMSGVELQTVLCAQGRDTPIIFLSAFQDEAIRASAIKGCGGAGGRSTPRSVNSDGWHRAATKKAAVQICGFLFAVGMTWIVYGT